MLHAADVTDLGFQAVVTAFAPSVTKAAALTPSSSVTPVIPATQFLGTS